MDPVARPPARGRQRYFVNSGLQLDYFVLNAHRPLFRDVRLRQAVNYAIDRRALAELGDGFQPLPEHPTDHYLPPGMPGYRYAHVYPLSPDPVKATQLASGKGRTAVLYTCNVSPCSGAGADRQEQSRRDRATRRDQDVPARDAVVELVPSPVRDSI